MFDTETIYEVVVFSIGDTKAGSKMGKLQLKDPRDNSLLNCILWEETLHRIDEKVFRCGNKLRIAAGTFNEKYNNCLVSALELVEEAKTGSTIVANAIVAHEVGEVDIRYQLSQPWGIVECYSCARYRERIFRRVPVLRYYVRVGGNTHVAHTCCSSIRGNGL